jgi:adenosine kinase
VGLVHNLPLDVSGRIGALASAYCIEQKGCQEHSFTPATFAERYRAAFGAELALNHVGAAR